MSEKTRIAALRAAVSIPAIRDDGLTEVLFCASALDKWLVAHPVSRPSLLGITNHLRRAFFRQSVHDGAGVNHKLCDVLTAIIRLIKGSRRACSSFCFGNGNRHLPNKTFFRRRKFAHSISSSILADGDSGDSVAADPRNNGTPDTSEKGVNGDA